jgi:hypothetical protein
VNAHAELTDDQVASMLDEECQRWRDCEPERAASRRAECFEASWADDDVDGEQARGQVGHEPPRWLVPLEEFMGHEEPTDDDADDWIVRDIIPRGEPWILGGKPKTGKTWLAESLALHMALGRDWLGFANTLGRPARIHLLALEDCRKRSARRLWKLSRGMGIDYRDAAPYLRVSDAPLFLPDGVDALVREVAPWSPDVVIVDSITRVFVGDHNRTEHAVAFVRAWERVTRETGAAVGFIHHTRKGGDTLEDFAGSGVFTRHPRHTLLMSARPHSDDDGPRSSVVRVAGNLDIARDAFVLEFHRGADAEGRHTVALRDGGNPSRRTRKPKAASVDAERALAALRLATDKRATAAALVSSAPALFGSEATASRTLTRLRRDACLDTHGTITDAGRARLAPAQGARP